MPDNASHAAPLDNRAGVDFVPFEPEDITLIEDLIRRHPFPYAALNGLAWR